MRRGSTESIRDILVKLRYYASITVDLSLYSLAFNDRDAALEVLKIEREVDELYRRLVAKTIVALRSLSQAPLAVGLMALSSALDTITDASADLATLVLKGYPVHPYIEAIACQGEAVAFIRSARGTTRLPARVDVLAIKKSGKLIVAPTSEVIEEGDLVVARGPFDEVRQLAESLGAPDILSKCGLELQVQAMGGDPLATTLLMLKNTSRVMIDLAFYSLLNNDVEIAETVAEMEEYSDRLYHDVLEYIVASSYPGRSKEVISLLILVKSLEEFSDAALRVANVVRYGQNAPVIVSAIGEAEEAYVRVRFIKDSPVELEALDLEDRGFIPLALYKPRLRDWITPLPRKVTLEPGDELILKYYVIRGVEGRMLEEIRSLYLEPVKVERVEHST